MSQAGEAVVNGLPYIQAFRSFDQVVSKCFGVSLKEGYKEAIEDFKLLPQRYNVLDICTFSDINFRSTLCSNTSMSSSVR